MVDVSVIIPTYNRAQFIGDAIRSVQEQKYATSRQPELEIIVADDGSTDDTPQVIAAFSNQVTYLPCPHRGLPAAA
ncbi:MAG: glycosyltransferase [Caldilineaceae bacterium]